MAAGDERERVGYGAVLLLALSILLVFLYKNPLSFFTVNGGFTDNKEAGALKAALPEGSGAGAGEGTASGVGVDGNLPSMPGMPGVPIGLNSADLRELATLPGIGKELARRIVEKRVELGGFGSIEDLKQVRGIGDKKLEAIRGRVKVGG